MPPKIIYDDDCHYCTWATKWATEHGEFTPIGLTQLTDEERERLPEDYEKCAQLMTDDAVYSCGKATEQILVRMGIVPSGLADFLDQFEDYRKLREAGYHFMSNHRDLWSKVVHEDPPLRRFPDRGYPYDESEPSPNPRSSPGD